MGVPSGTDGSTQRLWTFSDQLSTIQAQQYRIETADGRVLESGIGDPSVSTSRGNFTELRYATGDARVGPALIERTERMSDGTLFSTTTNTYSGAVAGVSGAYFLSQTTTSGTGGPTRTRTWSGFDKDGRTANTSDDIDGTYSAAYVTSYNDYDALTAVTEPDGQTSGRLYPTTGAASAVGRYRGEERGAPPIRFRTWDYTRRGELDKVRVADSGQTNAEYTYDGLGRIAVERLPGADIRREMTYDDDARVRFIETFTNSGSSLLRRERFLYDGLGRILEVCDKTADSTPDDACTSTQVVFTYVYDAKGPFGTKTYCAGGTFGFSGFKLSDKFNMRRLGYVVDQEGATAYEYDVLGPKLMPTPTATRSGTQIPMADALL